LRFLFLFLITIVVLNPRLRRGLTENNFFQHLPAAGVEKSCFLSVSLLLGNGTFGGGGYQFDVFAQDAGSVSGSGGLPVLQALGNFVVAQVD
jgi:hypothetical protein